MCAMELRSWDFGPVKVAVNEAAIRAVQVLRRRATKAAALQPPPKKARTLQCRFGKIALDQLGVMKSCTAQTHYLKDSVGDRRILESRILQTCPSEICALDRSLVK